MAKFRQRSTMSKALRAGFRWVIQTQGSETLQGQPQHIQALPDRSLWRAAAFLPVNNNKRFSPSFCRAASAQRRWTIVDGVKGTTKNGQWLNRRVRFDHGFGH